MQAKRHHAVEVGRRHASWYLYHASCARICGDGLWHLWWWCVWHWERAALGMGKKLDYTCTPAHLKTEPAPHQNLLASGGWLPTPPSVAPRLKTPTHRCRNSCRTVAAAPATLRHRPATRPATPLRPCMARPPQPLRRCVAPVRMAELCRRGRQPGITHPPPHRMCWAVLCSCTGSDVSRLHEHNACPAPQQNMEHPVRCFVVLHLLQSSATTRHGWARTPPLCHTLRPLAGPTRGAGFT